MIINYSEALVKTLLQQRAIGIKDVNRHIGSRLPGGKRFGGIIDKIRIVNTVRTSEELAANWIRNNLRSRSS